MATKLKDADQGSNVSPETVTECLAEYTAMRTESQKLAGRIGTMLKRYEKRGVQVAEIKATHALARLEGEVAKQRIRTGLRYAQIAGLIEWNTDGQGDFAQAMTATPAAPTSAAAAKLATARAYNDGYNSGKGGAAVDANPFAHQPGSEQFVAWQCGQGDGAEARAERQTVAGKAGRPKKEGTERVAQPRRRGKRNGAAAADEGVVGHA